MPQSTNESGQCYHTAQLNLAGDEGNKVRKWTGGIEPDQVWGKSTPVGARAGNNSTVPAVAWHGEGVCSLLSALNRSRDSPHRQIPRQRAGAVLVV